MMSFSDLQRSVVKITDENSKLKGTGFFITGEGHLLTNYHVIRCMVEESIRVEFNGEALPVSLEASFESEDFALLKINRSDTPYCLLGENWNEGDTVRSFGFHRTDRFPQGFPVEGKITGLATLERGHRRHDVITIRAIKGGRGLSGAPAFDEHTGKVIGILTFRDGENDGLAIPIKVVIQECPGLKELLPCELPPFITFRREVMNLYEILGYRVRTDVKVGFGSKRADLIVERKLPGHNLMVRTVVKLDYRLERGHVDRTSATEFMDLFESAKSEGKADFGALITDTDFSPEAKDIFEKGDYVESLTYLQLMANVVDVERYIENVIYDYENFKERKPVIEFMERDNLYKYYISLSAKDIDGQWYKSIDEFVNSWLEYEQRNHLSILGDFGTGKSSFCLNLTYKLAKKYHESPIGNRIPILVPLREHTEPDRVVDIEALITKLLKQYRIESSADFLSLMKAGKFVLIFDGFDEMAPPTDRQRTLRNLESLNNVVVGSNKVILTCRTHYFTTQKEITGTLSPVHDTELMRFVRDRPNFEILFLEALNENQIKSYLQKHTDKWNSILEKIRDTYDLPDLAKRPLLLHMIAENGNRLLERVNFRAVDLYSDFTGMWIKIDERRSEMTPEGKAEFMKELAFLMFSQDEKQSIHYTELSKPIREHFKEYITPLTKDAYDNDVRTCSFLNRDEDGNYRFIHKSFMEFFVAKKLSQELEHGTYDNFDKERIGVEIARFMASLIKDVESTKNDLWQCIDDTKGKTFDQVRYRGTNAVMLLQQLGDENEFAGKDLSHRVLRAADFQNLNLTGSDFSHVDLRAANFNHSILVDADFSEAELQDVSLGENNAIYGIDVNPNKNELAIAGSDGNVKILNLDSQKYISTLPGHVNNVKAVAYSPDGRYLVSGGIDRSIRVWDISKRQELIRLRGHERGVRSIAYSRTGKFVASGSYDSTVRIWLIDVENKEGKEKHCLIAHREPVYSIAFTPSGEQLASGSADGTIRIWDVESGGQVAYLEHSGAVNAIAYNHDGTLIAGGDGKERVRIWNLQDNQEKVSYSGHSALIFSVRFSPDDGYVASGDQAGQIIIWDLKSQGLYWEISNAHLGVVNALRFLNKGRWLASGAEDRMLKLWDIGTKEMIKSEGVEEGLHVEGMKITGAKGLSAARIRFLKDKGTID